jgi:hypothetical protein
VNWSDNNGSTSDIPIRRSTIRAVPWVSSLNEWAIEYAKLYDLLGKSYLALSKSYWALGRICQVALKMWWNAQYLALGTFCQVPSTWQCQVPSIRWNEPLISMKDQSVSIFEFSGEGREREGRKLTSPGFIEGQWSALLLLLHQELWPDLNDLMRIDTNTQSFHVLFRLLKTGISLIQFMTSLTSWNFQTSFLNCSHKTIREIRNVKGMLRNIKCVHIWGWVLLSETSFIEVS